MFIPLETTLTFSGATEESTSFTGLRFTLEVLQYSLPAQPPRATSQVIVTLLGYPVGGFSSRNPRYQQKDYLGQRLE